MTWLVELRKMPHAERRNFLVLSVFSEALLSVACSLDSRQDGPYAPCARQLRYPYSFLPQTRRILYIQPSDTLRTRLGVENHHFAENNRL